MGRLRVIIQLSSTRRMGWCGLDDPQPLTLALEAWSSSPFLSFVGMTHSSTENTCLYNTLYEVTFSKYWSLA